MHKDMCLEFQGGHFPNCLHPDPPITPSTTARSVFHKDSLQVLYETKVRDGDNGHPTIDPTFEWNQTIVLVHVYQFVWDPQTNRKAMFELQ